MKKMYYVRNDDGSIEYTRHDGCEQYLITISSTGDPIETATVETSGGTLGPYDVDQYEDICNCIKKNLRWFEDMSQEEADEHIQNLSEAWGIQADELSYLI